MILILEGKKWSVVKIYSNNSSFDPKNLYNDSFETEKDNNR